MQYYRQIAGLVLSALVFVASGCGEDVERLEVHPVKGVVHFKGEPMKGGGSIQFRPLEKGGKDASGTIDENGNFTLSSYRGEDGVGAPAGQYRVVVYQVTTKEGEASTDGEEVATESVETVEIKDQIPAIYSDAARSPLIQEIKAGDNDLKIEMIANPDPEEGA